MSEIEDLLDQYNKLELNHVQDHERFSHYAIVHHSSHIEGSTLTMTDTELLLSEGITPKGKPLQHSLMERDHFAALLHTLAIAKQERPLTVADIREINALVNKSTGGIIHTALGSVDVSKGEFRKSNVVAGDTYFVNYDKVERLTAKLVEEINKRLRTAQTLQEKLDLAFSAHFDFVSIHPFIDGNGRTTRLLMNYIQARFGLPLAIVFSEDRKDYIDALKLTRKKEDLAIFIAFMENQYAKLLKAEIEKAETLKPKTDNRKGRGFSLVF